MDEYLNASFVKFGIKPSARSPGVLGVPPTWPLTSSPSPPTAWTRGLQHPSPQIDTGTDHFHVAGILLFHLVGGCYPSSLKTGSQNADFSKPSQLSHTAQLDGRLDRS